ncbi:MAG: sulfurtransferase TusA family protein [Pseudomonadota bacterium]
MAVTVDARGLSCPQPVIMTLDEIKKGKDNEIIVLVDTDTSKENVSRAAESQGFRINNVTPEGEGYRITITKG